MGVINKEDEIDILSIPEWNERKFLFITIATTSAKALTAATVAIFL